MTSADRPTAPSVDELCVLVQGLAGLDGSGTPEAGLVDALTALERLKSAAAAAQARVTAAFAASRSRAEAARGVAASQRGRGLASEVGLARRDSPVRGGRHLGLAQALVHEMPHTLAALTAGDISEWRATLLVRETAILSREHRTQVDTELAGQLTTLGDQAVAAAARKIGYRLDPGSALRRVRGATADRHVSLRPAPDTMTYLTGFLPVAQGVACKVALEKYADTRRADGDERSKGQLMADALVERVTGQTHADAVDVEVQVVMTDTALLAAATDDDNRDAVVRGESEDAADEPAWFTGFGPVPAAVARDVVRKAARAWVRRLFLDRDGRHLVAMDSRRREFTGQLREFLITRDQTCRNPWCDAPVRHLDHIHRAADDGPTTADNGQGLCAACNQAREADGWQVTRTRGRPGEHVVETTTPTGHRHRSRPPRPVGARLETFTPGERGLTLLFDVA